MRKEGSGEETTLIGVCAHVKVHTTQFSLQMQSGSSQRSLGDSINFFFSMVGNGFCITTGTKNENTIFSKKKKGKRRDEKQEIGEKREEKRWKRKKESEERNM